jgi:photosystem I subunit X
MLDSMLLLAAIGPKSQTWSPTIAIVMAVCTVLGILAAGGAKKAGPTLLGGLTAGQVLGGASFGHVIGAGAVLGLTRLGVL